MDEKDDLMARTMVENLSIGINPITGRALPDSDSCANEVVQEALRTVLKHCSLESYGSLLEKQRKEKKEQAKQRKERRAAEYPNGGTAWSEEEDTLLRNLYLCRENSIWQIAHILKRTPGAVATRLKKCGYRKPR